MKKSTSCLSGVAIGIVGMLSANIASAWTLTATGTITESIVTPFLPVGPFSSSFDNAGLFGPSGMSLLGKSYSLTITTDPWLNANVGLTYDYGAVSGISSSNLNGAIAPSSMVTATVDGKSFSELIAPTQSTALSFSSLQDGLSHNYSDRQPFEDFLRQGTTSDGCILGGSFTSNGTSCVAASIQANSYTTPFIPYLDFNLVSELSSGFGGDSIADFAFVGADNSQADSTQFYGTIDSLSINTPPPSVPEPDGLVLLAAGIAGVAMVRRRKLTITIRNPSRY